MSEVRIHLTPEPDGACRVHATCAGREWQHLAPAGEVAAARRAVRAFMEKFETGRRPIADPVEAADIGRSLRGTFLPPLYAGTDGPLFENKGALLFTSTGADYLNLPWELLPGPGRGYLVEDPRWAIRRTTREELPASTSPLVARPLRILFMACAPTDIPGLDYEKEEEAFLRLANRLGGKIHLDIAEAGTFDELRDLIAEYKPHVVHLSGHGALRDGVGTFAFENERGRLDERDAGKIADHAFAGKGVRLVFFSGCQTAQAGAAGLCQSLTATGHVPLALGWGESIGDDLATEFARAFYHDLAAGLPIDHAVSAARRTLYDRCRVRRNGTEFLDASFALPQLYASEKANTLIDESLPPDRIERPGIRYELLADNIRGLREGFVGRRRVLQRTRPALRTGEKHVLLLTGIGGAGKSTLATRLANRFRQDGYHIAAVRAQNGELGAQFCLRILTEIAVACQRLGREADECVLLDGKREAAHRLRLAVEVLNEARILLVLDNLEAAMPPPPATPQWSDPEFAGFMTDLTSRLVGEGRAILTCRYVPHGFDVNAPNLAHEPLPDFTEADFIKYLRRHEEVHTRIELGELPVDLIETFHRKLGGTPRFIDQACAVLATIESDSLREQLERVETPKPGIDADEIHQLQQKYFRDLFLPQLYEALAPEERLALSRQALIEVPLPIEGVAAIAALELSVAQTMVNRCLGLGLLQRFGEEGDVPLYAAYPLQRVFLTDPARLDEASARDTHRAAARYLRGCFELDREERLRQSIWMVLSVCADHASEGDDIECHRWAVIKLAQHLLKVAEYDAALLLVEPLMRHERHPDSLEILGAVALNTGRWRLARSIFTEILEVRRAAGDPEGEAVCFHQLAMIADNEGKRAEARLHYEQSLEICQSIGDSAGEASELHGLATVYISENEDDKARQLLTRSLAIRQSIDDLEGEAASVHALATLDYREKEFQKAREGFRRSLTLTRIIGDRHGEAATLHNLATIDLDEGKFRKARQDFGESLAIKQAIHDRAGEATTLFQIGVMAWDRKQTEVGIRLVALCYAIESSIGSGEVQRTLSMLTTTAHQMLLDRAGFDTLIEEVKETYRRDRAASLVAAAFEGLEDSSTEGG